MRKGLYVHYPICSRACSYCDFFFRVNPKKKPYVEEAILNELYNIKENEFRTLYFGGGTPSLANVKFLEKIISSVKLPGNTEITLEANPEDVSEEKIINWKNIGINRISLGIQSLNDKVLQELRRPHTKKEALKAVELVKKHYKNFSVDFIIGIPFEDFNNFKHYFNNFIEEFSPPHISIYILTIEENTVFGRKFSKGKLQLKPDEKTVEEFYFVKDLLENHGYIHYEISNYAIEGYKAVHNSLYWKHKPYVGIGPSAHSFDFWYRKANIYNLHKYITSVKSSGKPEIEFVEELTPKDIFNEKIMLGLRKIREGVKFRELEFYFKEFPEARREFTRLLKQAEAKGNIIIQNDSFIIAKDKLIMSDYIISELLL